MAEKKQARNIGLQVNPPSESCTDKNCPFHGILPIRGRTLTGTIISTKMQGTVAIKREFMRYVPKYERYEKRTATYHAHCPPCIPCKVGDRVRIAECRPLSKIVSFVTIEKL